MRVAFRNTRYAMWDGKVWAAARPGPLRVEDRTYVVTWIGFVDVDSVIDTSSGLIVDWRLSDSLSLVRVSSTPGVINRRGAS